MGYPGIEIAGRGVCKDKKYNHGRKIGADPPLESLKPPLPLPETQKSAFQRGYIQDPPTEQNLTCSLGAARV